MTINHEGYKLFCQLDNQNPQFSSEEKKSLANFVMTCVQQDRQKCLPELVKYADENYQLFLIMHYTRHVKNPDLSDVFLRIQQKQYHDLKSFLQDISFVHDLACARPAFWKLYAHEISPFNDGLKQLCQSIEKGHVIANELGLIRFPILPTKPGLFHLKTQAFAPVEMQFQQWLQAFFPHSVPRLR
jgi:hypothetical protein